MLGVSLSSTVVPAKILYPSGKSLVPVTESVAPASWQTFNDHSGHGQSDAGQLGSVQGEGS